MAEKSKLNAVDVLRFTKNNDARESRIEAAPAASLPSDFPVNRLSAALHPDVQYAKVAEIKEWDENCKSYTFVPDPDKGTERFAYFKAGAYICMELEINGTRISRPYSISSSPKEALEGKYILTIKRVPGGLVSNYVIDHLKTGDSVRLSGPQGDFGYIPVRDGKTVIGIAGGSGITPFHSFAKAITDGDEDFRLILLYGSRAEKDILFKEDFDRLQEQSDNIKVIHVLSDEEKPGYEHGFISADLIRKYTPENSYSIFLSGPPAMYRFFDEEMPKLGLESKWIRFDLRGEIHDPRKEKDCPADIESPKEIEITVRMNGTERKIHANTDDTILQSLEKNGITAQSRCRSGECGWCHSLLLSGNVYCPASREHRREADIRYNYIHPCCTFPMSDIAIEIPYAE